MLYIHKWIRKYSLNLKKKCMGIYCYEHLWLECNDNTWETEARRAAHYSSHALYVQTNETIQRTACYNNSNIQELDSLRQWHGCFLKIRSTCMTEISLLCHFSTLNYKSQCSQSRHQTFFNKLPERRGGFCSLCSPNSVCWIFREVCN